MSEHKESGEYRLYAMIPSQENMERAAAARFQRVTPGYALVYAQSSPGGEAMEVKGEELHRLDRRDQAWLYDCVKLLLRDKLKESEEETRQRLDDLIGRLEKELSAEAEKEKGGAP